MNRKPRGERLLSLVLEAAILGLVIMVAVQVAKTSDPLLCKAEGRRLTDAELAAESLVFLRGDQFDTPFLPRPLPEGYDISNAEALFADPCFRFHVVRRAGSPGAPVGPRRSWLGRQIFGERLAVFVTLPPDMPGQPMLQVHHVSSPCGQVRKDLGYQKYEQGLTPPPSETE